MAVNIEDAGFEIRDMIAWVYGSGFPKSHNIGKAVDKLQGNEREVVGKKHNTYDGSIRNPENHKSPAELSNIGKWGLKQTPHGMNETKGTSEWEGWGTALKPALEPITVARKPLGEKTVAENCLKWGVGGINIDESRVESKPRLTGTLNKGEEIKAEPTSFKGSGTRKLQTGYDEKMAESNLGRFPANLIHDGSDEVVGLFPNSKSAGEYKKDKLNTFIPEEAMFPLGYQTNAYAGDSGSASRFFYCAKASKKERNIGCEGLEEKERVNYGGFHSEQGLINNNRNPENRKPTTNNHPTVKPIALMEYLVKLVSREGQVILDPFMGSGTTGMACKKLNRDFVGIEMNEDYMEIAKARIKAAHLTEEEILEKDQLKLSTAKNA
jgi:site-specific DNA-methyltransferase (adenine-specific)